jgi:hypothetical protein
MNRYQLRPSTNAQPKCRTVKMTLETAWEAAQTRASEIQGPDPFRTHQQLRFSFRLGIIAKRQRQILIIVHRFFLLARTITEFS